MQFQLEPHQTSKAVNVVANSAVVITPAVGATARVEYTTDTMTKILNGTATWAVWSYGTVTTATRDTPSTAVHMRVTAELGEVVVDVHLLKDEVSSASVGQTAAISGAPSVGSVLTASLPKGVTGTLQWTRTQATTPFTKSNISGATASAVNSLAYTVQQADAGCTLGCDASSTVSASTGVSVPAPAVTLRNNGVSRWLGTQAHNGLGIASASGYGSVLKVQAPGGAIACRVAFHNNAVNFSTKGYRVAVAPTDIGAIDTVANAFSAQVNSTINNSLYNSSTNPNGFRKGTFGGNASSRRVGKGNAVLPSLGYNNQEDTVISDRIDLPLTPIRARDRQNEEYYFIFRFMVDCVNGQDGYQTLNRNYVYDMMNSWSATNGADTPLMICSSTTSDPVNTLTALPSDPPGSVGGTVSNRMTNNCPAFSIEWIYPASVTPITFWHVGDSITESYNWNRWAVQRKNTNPLRPLHHVNLGGSTTRTESFLGNMYLHLQSMTKPDYVVMPIISINNYSGALVFDLPNAALEYTRLQEVAQYLTGLGIKIIWWTPMNYTLNPTTPGDVSTPWFYLYTNAKNYAASHGITFMDINGDPRAVHAFEDTDPNGWIMGAPDHTHPTVNNGQPGFATIYGETLTSLGI